MTLEKELRKLSKPELIELLMESKKENERLMTQVKSLKGKLEEAKVNESEEISSLKAKLESREIMLTEAGNIAEASLKLNNIFEIAQNAADEYLKNIKSLNNRQEEVLLLKEIEANEQIEKMLDEAKSTCEKMKKEAEEEVALKWSAFEEKMDKFIDAHKGLKEILEVMGK